jgi:hypothetical protein
MSKSRRTHWVARSIALDRSLRAIGPRPIIRRSVSQAVLNSLLTETGARSV